MNFSESGQITIENPITSCTDKKLQQLIEGKSEEGFSKPIAIGIDAPFGWPTTFVEAVPDWNYKFWEGNSNKSFRESLRLRETDRWIRDVVGITPLRVSSDKIASVAMRAMSLLRYSSVEDKSGANAVKDQYFFEVYPAATLAKWGFVTKKNKTNETYSYKTGPEAKRMREKMLKDICNSLPRFSITPTLFSEYTTTDHAFDALISALTTYAAVKRNTTHPDEAHFNVPQPKKLRPELGKTEGWIHLPKEELQETFSLQK